ncbi:MAG TPA: DUF2637 domain-containing protein [Micromonosporaceae bacterium]|nr:DUF2637 domain-containing protein [Micromonosporaceae bacterium]
MVGGAHTLIRNVSSGGVAAIAAWSSYSHMVHLAVRHGERAEVAWALPFSVDGMLIVSTIVMVDDKRRGHRVRPMARIAFTAGVIASIAANIAAAHPTLGARVIAAWPAVALLLVVEMLARPPAAPSPTQPPDTAHQRPPSAQRPPIREVPPPINAEVPPVEAQVPAAVAARAEAPPHREVPPPAQADVAPHAGTDAEVPLARRRPPTPATTAPLSPPASHPEAHRRQHVAGTSSEALDTGLESARQRPVSAQRRPGIQTSRWSAAQSAVADMSGHGPLAQLPPPAEPRAAAPIELPPLAEPVPRASAAEGVGPAELVARASTAEVAGRRDRFVAGAAPGGPGLGSGTAGAAVDRARTDRAAAPAAVRRPTAATRQLAHMIMAAEPHLSRNEVANRLGVSTRRLREVLAA